MWNTGGAGAGLAPKHVTSQSGFGQKSQGISAYDIIPLRLLQRPIRYIRNGVATILEKRNEAFHFGTHEFESPANRPVPANLPSEPRSSFFPTKPFQENPTLSREAEVFYSDLSKHAMMAPGKSA
jgi:hypothetical protein